jgi:hypothetical protein
MSPAPESLPKEGVVLQSVGIISIVPGLCQLLRIGLPGTWANSDGHSSRPAYYYRARQ